MRRFSPHSVLTCSRLGRLAAAIETKVEDPRKAVGRCRSRKSKLLTTLSKLNSNMDFCYFIGIDIAKDTLDWAVYTQQGLQISTHTPNTLAGIKTALAEFKALPGWNAKQAVFCMEHTGIYNAHLLELLHQ